MSPTHFHDHAKNNNNNNGLCPPPLKVNKDSHMIAKKSSSSSSSPPSSSSSSSASCLGIAGPTKPPQQRHPVIIYTHSPKVIHTHPKDFMALVQKLTGLSRSEDEHPSATAAASQVIKQEKENASLMEDQEMKNINVNRIGGNDDNESSSVITTDENCASIGDGQVNSCFVFDPSSPYMTNFPVFTPNSADFLCPNQPFYNYNDSLFFNSPNMGTLEGMTEFREY